MIAFLILACLAYVQAAEFITINSHDETNSYEVPPIYPVTAANFSLWATDTRYASYGYLDYTGPNGVQDRYYAYMCVDKPNRKFLLFHTNNLHVINGNESFIAPRSPPNAGCRPATPELPAVGVHDGNFCYQRNEHTMESWNEGYLTGLKSDGRVRFVDIDNGLRKVIEYQGSVPDHHVAPILYNPDGSIKQANRKITKVVLQQFAHGTGRLKGMIKKHGWTQAIVTPAATIVIPFTYVAEHFVINPDPSLCERPSWASKAPVSAMNLFQL